MFKSLWNQRSTSKRKKVIRFIGFSGSDGRPLLMVLALSIVFSCVSTRSTGDKAPKRQKVSEEHAQMLAERTAAFGSAQDFEGSPYEEIGSRGLFNAHPAESCRISVLPNGDDSFAARIQTLRNADTSVRIQTLVFSGDESGLYITELLKEKKAQGLDVRVIVDAMSNPWPQTQWMYFDLKQHDIEVEGYESFYLQWLNEMPVTIHEDADKTTNPNKRFHEKMWIVDGETDHGLAIIGGSNIANEYFRVNPQNPRHYWRDQDVLVKGAVVKDMAASFDRNFQYFLKVKESRGIFNTNIYWEGTRRLLRRTGKVEMNHATDEQLSKSVREVANKNLDLKFESAASRFFQNRPRFGETYIEQVYLKLIAEAKREILVVNAYFIASPAFIQAVKDAARRCVNVIILTNSLQTNDLPLLTIVGRSYYDDMLVVNSEPEVRSCERGGVKIWEWQGRRSSADEQTEGTMHAKYAVFDRRVSVVGSHNMDPRSRTLNSESAIVYESEDLSRQLAEIFYENDLDFSRQITMKEAQEFADPKDAIYKLRKRFGKIFENLL